MMSRHLAILTLCVGGFVPLSAAVAQVTDIRLIPFTPTIGSTPQGFVTCHLVATFQQKYTSTQVLLELTSGSFYQHPLGSTEPVVPGILAIFPDLEADTIIANGSHIAGSTYGEPAIVGGAVDLGGEPTFEFSDTRINLAWATTPGNLPLNQSDFLVAQLTLSLDAAGTMLVRVADTGEFPIIREIPILPITKIPEPSSVASFCLGCLAIVGSRHRSNRRGNWGQPTDHIPRRFLQESA